MLQSPASLASRGRTAAGGSFLSSCAEYNLLWCRHLAGPMLLMVAAESRHGACSYCKNLNYAQQLLQPVNPNQYVDYDCVLPVSRCLDILVAEAVIYFIAAIYFDNVFADQNGVRRTPWCVPALLCSAPDAEESAAMLCNADVAPAVCLPCRALRRVP